MRRRRRLATLAASLALHATALLGVVLFVTRESGVGALFIDLTHWDDTGLDGSRGAPAGAPPARAAGRASRAGAPAPRASRAAEAPAPSTPAPAAEPAPPAPAPAPPAAAPERPPARPVVAEEPGDDAAPGPGGSAAATGGGTAPSVAGGVPGSVGVRGGGGVGTAPDVSHGLALAAPGAGGAGAQGAEYGPYLRQLRRRVQESLRYPPAARRRGLQGTVALDIVIRPDGALGVVVVADSSSHALLDEAALEAVRRLAPEPFPPGLTPRLLRVRLPVVFALE